MKRDVDDTHREITRGVGGKNEMNVEGEGDREGSDVSHPRGGGSRDEVFHEFYQKG